MSAPPVSDEVLHERVAAYNAAGRNQSKAADALGISRGALQDSLKRAASLGHMLDHPAAMPGFVVKSISEQQDADGKTTGRSVKQVAEPGEQFAPLPGHAIKGESALLDPEGRVLAKWVKTREGQIDPLAVAAALREAFADFKNAAEPAPLPAAHSTDLLTLLPANDWHVGLSVWGKQAGTNWDLRIAENTIGAAVEDTITRSPSSDECIVLGGGDLLHADSKRNETTSGTPQDVDGRYPKIVEVAARLMVRTVDAALRRHQHVTVRTLPGNHDEHSSVAISYFLLAWYRNEPRVTVDVDPSLFFWFRFGAVMLGATHGHTVKLASMPGIMAHRRAEDWGLTRFRYVHGFHIHHTSKVATEGNGVICESHQAPIPQDAWHFGSGYLSGRSLCAITYHREFGEIGRVRTAILDGQKGEA